MAKRFRMSKKKSVQKWIKGDKGTQNITTLPKYNMNQRGGLMLT